MLQVYCDEENVFFDWNSLLAAVLHDADDFTVRSWRTFAVYTDGKEEFLQFLNVADHPSIRRFFLDVLVFCADTGYDMGSTASRL